MISSELVAYIAVNSKRKKSLIIPSLTLFHIIVDCCTIVDYVVLSLKF